MTCFRFFPLAAFLLASVFLSAQASADYKPRNQGYAAKEGKARAAKRRAYRRPAPAYSRREQTYEPYIYFNGPYGYTPSFDNRTFWERVQTGRYGAQ